MSDEENIPEARTSAAKDQRGWYRKFKVERVDGRSEPGEKHHGCEYFVLDLTHDPFAPVAMRAYAEACAAPHPRLSEDINARLAVWGEDTPDPKPCCDDPANCVRPCVHRGKWMADRDAGRITTEPEPPADNEWLRAVRDAAQRQANAWGQKMEMHYRSLSQMTSGELDERERRDVEFHRAQVALAAALGACPQPQSTSGITAELTAEEETVDDDE